MDWNWMIENAYWKLALSLTLRNVLKI
jgi:hypothetical protein